MDLAFVTTDEIVRELMSRTTFVGVVIQSQQQHLEDFQEHKDFTLGTSLDKDSLTHVLASVLDDLQMNNFNERSIQ